MNKKICIMFVFVISLVLLLCGCQEQTDTENNNLDKNVELDSDIVEFVYSNLTQKINNGKVTGADVEYLFRNIAGRTINFTVTAEFYDAEDNLLYTGGPNNFYGITKDHIETTVPANKPNPNVISYNGINASKVDHVKIVVSEF